MKNLMTTSLVALFFCAGFAVAEEAPFVAFETDSLSIQLSKDGTGVVKGISCIGCNFNYVTITKNSKASINGEDVNILEARLRAGKRAMVSFGRDTREVQFIRWSE